MSRWGLRSVVDWSFWLVLKEDGVIGPSDGVDFALVTFPSMEKAEWFRMSVPFIDGFEPCEIPLVEHEELVEA